MWKLIEIYAQNICAFRELAYRPKQSVTTLVFGDNRDNESQRSNGSGKSALIETIAIGITGSPLRKIKNEEIINDNSDEALIELTFENDSSNEKFQIERKLFRKGSAEVACYIFRDGKFYEDEGIQPSIDAYNKYFLEKLGITKDELYNNFILSKHKYQDFLSCSDKEKKEIINRFSNGILVDQAIAEILVDKTPFEERLKKVDLELAGVDGRISILEEQIEKEEKDKEENAKTTNQKLASIDESIAEKRALLREKADELNALAVENTKIEETDKLIQELENSEQTLDDYLSKINSYVPLVSSKGMSDWSSVIKNKKEQIAKAEDELKTWDKAFAEAQKKANEATASYNVMYAEFQEFLKDHQGKAETYENELRRLGQEYDKINNEIEAIKKTRRTLSAAIESLNNKLAGVIACPSCGFEFIVADKEFDVDKGREDAKCKEEEYKILGSKINGDTQAIEKIEADQNSIRNNKRELASQKTAWTDKIGLSHENVTMAKYEMEKVKGNQSRITETINMIQTDIDGILRKVFDEAFDLIDQAYKANERKTNSVNEDAATLESSIETLEKTKKEMKKLTSSDFMDSLQKSLSEYRCQSLQILTRKNKIEAELNVLAQQEQNFIEFKTYLANTKIEALAKITNEFLENIGSDIRIKFSGYTVLKSGKVREKISISLIRAGLDCGSFGKFSAGEAARVNLATILSMQKLINANCDNGKGLDLLVLDEILEAVDEDGLAFMFAALNKIGTTTLVVSHGNIAESYPYKTKIIKENGESQIEE